MTRWSTACIFPDGNEHRRRKRFDLGKEKLPRSPTPFPNVSLVSASLLSGVGKALDLHIANVRMAECPQISFSSLFGFAKIWLPFSKRASNISLPTNKALNKQAENSVPSAPWQPARQIMSKGYLPAQCVICSYYQGNTPAASRVCHSEHILILETQQFRRHRECSQHDGTNTPTSLPLSWCLIYSLFSPSHLVCSRVPSFSPKRFGLPKLTLWPLLPHLYHPAYSPRKLRAEKVWIGRLILKRERPCPQRVKDTQNFRKSLPSLFRLLLPKHYFQLS